MITSDDLGSIPLLADLDAEALAWLGEHLEELVLATGDVLHEPGSPAEWLYITFSGEIRGVLRDGGRETGVFTYEPGTVGGMLPHSRMTAFPGTIKAVLPSRVGRLHKRDFPEMLRRIPALESRLAHLMADRIREQATQQLQQQKLASLGTMASGLAHELNNPAAAARRASVELCRTLQEFNEHASKMLGGLVAREPAGAEDPFQPIYDVLADEPPALDPLSRGELEDELSEWLGEQGVAEPWDGAATLVAAGFRRAGLAGFVEALVPEHVGDFLAWLPRDVALRQLANELAESTRRISDLVAAMKSYSYMDRADETMGVDLHKGLDDTLVILGHKLRQRGVEVVKRYGAVPTFSPRVFPAQTWRGGP